MCFYTAISYLFVFCFPSLSLAFVILFCLLILLFLAIIIIINYYYCYYFLPRYLITQQHENSIKAHNYPFLYCPFNLVNQLYTLQ
jgi:predicted membrane protein